MTIIIRVCTKCKVGKPLEDFYNSSKQSGNKYGKSSRCKDCERKRRQVYYLNNPDKCNQDKQQNRKNHLKQKYDITEEQYNQMLLAQGYLCAICDTEYIGRRLPVDHDHETGEVRGLLCFDCNIGIARLEHDPKILQRAIDYLNGVRSPVAT